MSADIWRNVLLWMLVCEFALILQRLWLMNDTLWVIARAISS